MCMYVSLTIATQLVFDNWIKLQQAERDQSANNGVMCIRPNYAFYGLKPSCCLLFLICNGAVGDRVPPFPTTQFKLFDFIHKYKYLHYSLKFWAILPLSSRFTRAQPVAFHEWGNICSHSERIPSWGGLCPTPFRLIFVYKYCVRVVLIIHSIHKRFACAPVACVQDEDKDEDEEGRGETRR